jgi:outer membrane biosynthesis protein TonB
MDLAGRAQALEPRNRDSSDLMEGARALPIGPEQKNGSEGALLLDAPLADGRLRNAAAPVYPPDAIAPRVDGVVKVRARVGKNGRVLETRLVVGPSLLAGAAMSVVKQYVYEPVLLNGSAVEFQTKVDVPFRLNR